MNFSLRKKEYKKLGYKKRGQAAFSVGVVPFSLYINYRVTVPLLQQKEYPVLYAH